jgi:hypothetical protein
VPACADRVVAARCRPWGAMVSDCR